MIFLSQGAEAIIEQDKKIVVKKRFEKLYRHPSLDKELRSFRTRRETKILETLDHLHFPSPKLLQSSDKTMEITMSFLDGPQVKQVLSKNPKKYGREIGTLLAILHAQDIIHGDLTTSNMILASEKIHFIDFGLSFVSKRVEDKAVDLHVLKQALESKHYQIFEETFEAVLAGYKKYADHFLILKQLAEVESRGRNKH